MAQNLRKTRSYYFMLAGVLGLLIAGSFIAYQIYSSLTSSQISKRQQVNIAPLDGTIESAAIDNLRSRRKFSEDEFGKIVLNK